MGVGCSAHWRRPPADRPPPASPHQLRRALLLIIGLPLNLVLLGFFCWYRAAGSPKRFATQLAGSGAAAALLVTLLLLHFRRLVRGRWWGVPPDLGRDVAEQRCLNCGCSCYCGCGSMAPGCSLACKHTCFPPLTPAFHPSAVCRSLWASLAARWCRAARAGTAPRAASPTAWCPEPSPGWTCCPRAHSELAVAAAAVLV